MSTIHVRNRGPNPVTVGKHLIGADAVVEITVEEWDEWRALDGSAGIIDAFLSTTRNGKRAKSKDEPESAPEPEPEADGDFSEPEKKTRRKRQSAVQN